MKGIWGLLGLVVTLAIVMLLVKKQIAPIHQTASPDAAEKTESVRVQSQQMQQQVRQAMEAAMATKRDAAADQ